MEKTEARDMTVGNPTRLLLLFTLPLLLGNLSQQLYTIVDTAVIGNRVGLFALSAIGSADRLIWLTQNLLIGLTAGFAVKAAIVKGEGDRAMLEKTVVRSALLTLAISLLVTLAAHLTASPLLTLIRTPDDARPIAMAYVRVLFTGLPVTAAYQLLTAMLRSLGDSKTPFRAMLVTSLLNIGLDLLFMGALGAGAEGAAIATVIAQAAGAAWCFIALRKMGFLRFRKEECLPDRGTDRRLLLLGMPVCLMNILIGLSGFAVQYAVNLHGSEVAAGVTATEKIYAVLELAGASLGFAMSAYAGQNYGAEEKKRVRLGLRSCVLSALAISLFFTLVLFLFGDAILGFIITGEEELRAVTLEHASAHLKVVAAALPFVYLILTLRSALQGVGNTVVPMIGGWAELILRCIWALLVCPSVGEWAVLFINAVAWTGSLAVNAFGCLRLVMRLKREENAPALAADAV